MYLWIVERHVERRSYVAMETFLCTYGFSIEYKEMPGGIDICVPYVYTDTCVPYVYIGMSLQDIYQSL